MIHKPSIRFLLIFSIIVIGLPDSQIFCLDPQKAPTQYILKHWNAEKNFPHQVVTSITQTEDGHLWIGTTDGLVTFDGFEFNVFNRDNIPIMRNNFVSTILRDSLDRLWIILDGRQLVMVDHHQWYDFGNPAVFLKNKKIFPTPDMNVLFMDNRGSLWIGTEGGGILVCDGKTFINYNRDDGLPNERITCITQDRQGDIWFGTRGGGICRFSDGVIEVLSKQHGLSSDYIMHLTFSQDGRLWISTNETGISHYQHGAFTNYSYPHHLTANAAVGMREDRDRNLWIGTVGGGLNRMSGKKFSFLNSSNGFPGDVISCIYEDREHQLWIGTSGAGLIQLRDGRVSSLTPREGLSAQNVCPVFQSRDSTIYVGTFGGGVNLINDGTIRHLGSRQGINNNILSFAEDGIGRLWIGSYGGGVYVLENGSIKRNVNTKNGLSTNLVKSVFADRDQKIWIGTDGGGINVISGNDISVMTHREGLPGDNINFIYQMRSGEYWIGTDMAGLCIYDGNRYRTYTARDSLSANTFFSVHEDTSGHVWLATYKGITHYHPKTGFTAMTAKQGLFDNSVSQILEDDDQCLWMLTSRGIAYVEKRTLFDWIDKKIPMHNQWFLIRQDDGMVTEVGSEYCYPAGWKMHNGELWFATVKGVIIVDPRTAKKKPVFPDVMLKRMTVDQKDDNLKQPLIISSSSKRIEIAFTAILLSQPSRLNFRYILEGYDREWIDAKKERTAYYGNLPYGQYRFRVKASDTYNVWGEQEYSIGLTVTPRFTETPVFYVLTGLAFLGAILLIMRLRLRHLRHREEILEKIVAEKTEVVNRQNNQLEQALAELRRTQSQLIQSEKMTSLGQLAAGMAHEINNPLSFIHGNLEYISDYVQKSFTDKQSVTETGVSVTGKEIVNALQSSMNGVKRISEVLGNLKNFSKIEHAEHSDIFINRDIESIIDLFFGRLEDIRLTRRYDPALDTVPVSCRAGEINLALKNIMMNALYAVRDAVRHNLLDPTTGEITIETKLSGDYSAEIIITDNGIGIPEEHLPKIFDPFFTTRPVGSGKGLGLSEAYGIIRNHGGSIQVQSTPREGTSVTVTLFLHKQTNTGKP